MKNTVFICIRAIVRVLIFMTVTLFGLSGCAWGTNKSVSSVKTMTLTVRGMRGSHVYEFAGDELRLYREVYAGKEIARELEKSVPCDAQTMVARMNACGVMRWDGFHGKHPKNVQDGIMFDFKATVNDGQMVRADGSANFPKGYREFVRALDGMLAGNE